MTEAFICDAVRTPIGRYGGALAHIRADDLAAIPIRALTERNPKVDWADLDDVILGCANQAGEDNRNLARMAGLLAGLPDSSGGVTLNRLCGSGLDAVAMAARAIRGGESELIIAGGSESMSRAPFVMPKAAHAFDRHAEIYDTTMGWRFVNPKMRDAYGDDTMPSTAENVADEFKISREDQDAFALRSQQRTAAAQDSGRLAAEIVAGRNPAPQGRSDHRRPRRASARHQPRSARQAEADRPQGRHGDRRQLVGRQRRRRRADHRQRRSGQAQRPDAARADPRRRGRRRAAADHGHRPRPGLAETAQAARHAIGDIDVIELNEAFAAQALAVLRQLGLPDDADHVNPNGGAIALGHPLGMSGARLALTATEELQRSNGRYALATMCIGVGQGIALALERV